MLTITSKYFLIIILLLGSTPSSFAHPCASKIEITKETKVNNLTNKTPCHNGSIEQSSLELCECLNCSCPDSCNNIEVNRFSVLLQVFEFKQVNIMISINSFVPVNPSTPLFRPPIRS